MKKGKPNLVSFLKAFKDCFFYETKYAIGGSKYSAITENDFKFDILPDIVKKLMCYWNKHQEDMCVENIKKLSERTDEGSKQRLHRNKVTLKQLVDNDYKQFVHADTGLIVSLIEKCAPYKLRSIKYDLETRNAYPILGEGTDLKVIQPDNIFDYRKFQINVMKEIFIRF